MNLLTHYPQSLDGLLSPLLVSLFWLALAKLVAGTVLAQFASAVLLSTVHHEPNRHVNGTRHLVNETSQRAITVLGDVAVFPVPLSEQNSSKKGLSEILRILLDAMSLLHGHAGVELLLAAGVLLHVGLK